MRVICHLMSSVSDVSLLCCCLCGLRFLLVFFQTLSLFADIGLPSSGRAFFFGSVPHLLLWISRIVFTVWHG